MMEQFIHASLTKNDEVCHLTANHSFTTKIHKYSVVRRERKISCKLVEDARRNTLTLSMIDKR